MRIAFFIITTLIALSTKAQIIEKELKTSGSLVVPAIKNVNDTLIHYTHDAPSFKKTKPPLLIVNGKRKSFNSILQLDNNLIDSVYVVKGKEAILKYGLGARNGVIVVALKKG